MKRIWLTACVSAFALCAATPITPLYYVNLAQNQLGVAEKVGFLRQLLATYPVGDQSALVHDQLVTLLAGSNRFEEALQEYQVSHPGIKDSALVDFKLLDYQLKTGRFAEVLHGTKVTAGSGHLSRDLHVLELRAQALLAQGQFRLARQEVEGWLSLYLMEGVPGNLFEADVQSIVFLKRHLRTLERLYGAVGKPLFTAAMAESFRQWSHQSDVPVYFFKLMPVHSGGAGPSLLQPGRFEVESFFQKHVDEINRGFGYLSNGQFSLHFSGLKTLYVRPGDVDPTTAGGRVLTSSVYAHSLPLLYRLAGNAFIVLVDYRDNATGQAAYIGDGILHISADKFQTLTLMHEILHGLGATHQDWSYLERQGYKFDPEDRGLMTFENGELNYFGLETKNRDLLGWPAVAIVRLSGHTEFAAAPIAPENTIVASARLAPLN